MTATRARRWVSSIRPPLRSGALPLPMAAALAVTSGGCVLAAFPTLNWWWLAPVGVAVLLLALWRQPLPRAALLGFCHGLAFFVPLLHWTGLYVGWFPWLALAVFQAGYGALLGVGTAAASWLFRRPRAVVLVPFVTATLWVAVETLRSAQPWGGFPWGRLAFSQADSPLLYWATVGGAPAVTAAVALVGGCLALPALLFEPATAWRTVRSTLPGVAAALGLIVGVGFMAGAAQDGVGSGKRVTIAVIQGNVPRAGLEFNAQRRAVLENHATETRALAESVARGERPRPDLVVWPENSVDIDPYQYDDAAELISEAATAIGAPILIGAVVDAPGGRVYNMGIVWDPATGPGERYVKRHPVPFAEYVPHRDFFRFFTEKVDLVRQDFAAGNRPGVMRLGPVRIGDVICFEVAYDPLVTDVVRGGAHLIVVQTNNATFGRSAQSAQQLAMVRLRAVEHQRFAVMASTTGISATVSPNGEVLDASSLFTPAVLLRSADIRTPRTLATIVGGWPAWVMSFIAMCAVGAGWFARRSEGDAMPSSGPPAAVATTGTPEEVDVAIDTSAGEAPDAPRTWRLGEVLVVVPTYNEAENITQITSRLRAAVPAASVLIVDDNSSDGTGQLADELAADDDNVHVMHRPGKQGLGTAYVAGFGWARERGYSIIVECDADGSHAPEQLPALLDAVNSADVAIGSRWIPGGEVVNWPKRRQLLSRMANVYVRLVLGIGVRDATAGYRAYRQEVLDAIDFTQVSSQGYCFQVDLTWRAVQAGFSVAEVPITFTERSQGVSKMSSKIIGEAFWLVAIWGVRSRIRRSKRAVVRLFRR